jgi:hypothetical protein
MDNNPYRSPQAGPRRIARKRVRARSICLFSWAVAGPSLIGLFVPTLVIPDQPVLGSIVGGFAYVGIFVGLICGSFAGIVWMIGTEE